MIVCTGPYTSGTVSPCRTSEKYENIILPSSPPASISEAISSFEVFRPETPVYQQRKQSQVRQQKHQGDRPHSTHTIHPKYDSRISRLLKKKGTHPYNPETIQQKGSQLLIHEGHTTLDSRSLAFTRFHVDVQRPDCPLHFQTYITQRSAIAEHTTESHISSMTKEVTGSIQTYVPHQRGSS